MGRRLEELPSECGLFIAPRRPLEKGRALPPNVRVPGHRWSVPIQKLQEVIWQDVRLAQATFIGGLARQLMPRGGDGNENGNANGNKKPGRVFCPSVNPDKNGSRSEPVRAPPQQTGITWEMHSSSIEIFFPNSHQVRTHGGKNIQVGHSESARWGWWPNQRIRSLSPNSPHQNPASDRNRYANDVWPPGGKRRTGTCAPRRALTPYM